jgi:hypothetical protein
LSRAFIACSVEDHHARARLEGQAEDLAHGVANVLDLDRLAGQEARGRLRHHHDQIRMDTARGAIARTAGVAGLARTFVAEEAPRGLDGQRALPHAFRAAEQERGRQAALAQRTTRHAVR